MRAFFQLPNFRPPFSQLCLFLGFAVLVSCDAPVKTEPKTEGSSPPPSTEEPPAEISVVSEESQKPEETVEVKTEESAPEMPLSPYLDVLENEAEKKITISGSISSQFQARDIYESLRSNFPEMEVITELKSDPQIPEVAWGNRADSILLPFIDLVENAHFRYDKGVTLIAGTVESRGDINQIMQKTVYVMEGPDARGISNKLKVKGEEE